MSQAATVLRDARKRNNLDQRTLARRAGTTQAQISRIERGEISPGVDTLARLLAAMGERLALTSAPGPRGNARTADLRRDLEHLTPGERVGQAIELSRMLTGIRTANGGVTPMPDQLHGGELLSAMNHTQVDFVVAGVLALAAHGAIRATERVDIVPDPEPGNLARLAAALKAINAQVDLKDLDTSELGIAPDADGLAQGGNWVLRTDLGLLDILQEVAGVSGYGQLRPAAVAMRVPGISGPVLAAGYDHVIAMKTAAGRDQDLIDIDALQRARGERD